MFGPSLALAAFVLASTPSTDPFALVNQLGSARYLSRESAEADLLKLGRSALPPLRAARASKDPEIRLRASALVVKLEGSLLTQATEVSFDFQETPITEAVRSINKRSGLSLSLEAPSRREDFGRPMTLQSAEPLPFWKAIDALCASGQLHYVPGAQLPIGRVEGTFPLYEGPDATREPSSDFGPFRVHLMSLQPSAQEPVLAPGMLPRSIPRVPIVPEIIGRPKSSPSKALSVQFCVASEPRLSISQNGPVKWAAAVDDRGQTLLIPPHSGTFQHYAGYSGMNPTAMVRLRAELVSPAEPGRRIRLIRGSIPVVVAARKPEPLEIALADASGKTFRNDDVSVTLKDYRPARTNQPPAIELAIVSNGPTSQPTPFVDGEPLGFRPDNSHHQIEILDSEGKPLAWFPSGILYNGKETRLTLTLVGRGSFPTPSKVRYHGILRTTAEIPFEFRDVPMP